MKRHITHSTEDQVVSWSDTFDKNGQIMAVKCVFDLQTRKATEYHYRVIRPEQYRPWDEVPRPGVVDDSALELETFVLDDLVENFDGGLSACDGCLAAQGSYVEYDDRGHSRCSTVSDIEYALWSIGLLHNRLDGEWIW